MAGTNRIGNIFYSSPTIILKNPQLPENIGMCARAMLNYGFTDLRIVGPKIQWPNKKSIASSAGALDIINNTTNIYNLFDDALEGIDVLFATSVRNRDLEKIVITPKDAVRKINTKYKNAKIGFLFGPEKAGLKNRDLSEANYIIQIPSNQRFGSLNLAMAVNTICYEFFINVIKKKNNNETNSKFVDKKKIALFKNHLIKILYEIKYFNREKNDSKLETNVRNIFSRTMFTEKELLMLYGVIKGLKNYKNK